MDWIEKLFSKSGTLSILLLSGAIGLIVGFLQGLLQLKYGGLSGFLTALASSTLAAGLVGLGISDYIQTEGLRWCIIGVCAFLGQDVLAGLSALGKGLREDPLGFLMRLMEALRGIKSTAPKVEK